MRFIDLFAGLGGFHLALSSLGHRCAFASEFDPDLADRRKFGDWEVNLSQAITALDVPMVQTDREPQLLQLFTNYSSLLEHQRTHFPELAILPSVNMLDGKAKQFDDGLYAALEQAILRETEPGLSLIHI